MVGGPCPARSTASVATSPIVATPCGGRSFSERGYKAWESEESEENDEGREGDWGGGGRPEQQQAAAAAVAREKRRQIRRLSFVILALLGAVIACRWLGIG